MELMHRRCAGLDVHKATVVACKRIVEQNHVRREVKTFKTTTGALYEGCGSFGTTFVRPASVPRF